MKKGRSELIALGLIVPHPELGRQYRQGKNLDNPSPGPSCAQPWRTEACLRLDSLGIKEAAKELAGYYIGQRRERRAA